MVKLSDYVARYLADQGVRHLFLVTGGGAMHLNDSFGQEKRIQCICNHHEQASAMAAEGYARISGELGVVNVTTGPGGINAMNGVFGAWTDSIPMLVISGQVKRETCLASYHLPGLRQLGDQEADIISMVRGITKYSTMVLEPEMILYHLQKAIYLAKNGRPGPCWLDIPVDVQASQIDETSLMSYDPAEDELAFDRETIKRVCNDVLNRLRNALRPVIMAGSGVRHAKALEEFQRLVQSLGIPVTTAWTHDLIATDDPHFCGRSGTIGERAGNFTVQNADVLLVLGSRLNIRQISYNWKAFARHAFKIQVDVDAAELNKPTVKPDMPVHCDLLLFLEIMNQQIAETEWKKESFSRWRAWCKERLRKYPSVTPKQRIFNGKINPYHFMDCLFHQLVSDDVVISANATACIVAFQTGFLKMGQRLISNSGSASMGHDLPMSIGASVAQKGKRVICLAGDGSIQLNIQELQTIKHHQLPIKIFVLNNNGYLSIRLTQKNFFGRLLGESPQSGVSFPEITKIADAYGIPSMRLDTEDFIPQLRQALNTSGPVVCEVMLDPDQAYEPKVSSKQMPDGRIVSPPIEDMAPFLDEQEFRSNMIVQ